MATVKIDMKQLEDTLKTNDVVLIDFWADWCGPCKMFGPVFEEASENHPDVVFAKCNTEEDQELAAAFNVRSIPTLAVFRENILLYNQAGAVPAASLDDLIKQVKNLDMDEIRAKIAASQEASN